MIITAALMLKAPRPGFVKTRLAAAIGDRPACDIYRRLVERQLNEIPHEWNVAIHFAPADAMTEISTWLMPTHVKIAEFRPQIDGDLGARMLAAVATEFANGSDVVVLLGGDCPTLNREHLFEAANLMPTTDVVMIPATDGGYVALLLKAAHTCLFSDIAWSTSKVLETTLDRCRVAELDVRCLLPHEDVDDLVSLRRCAFWHPDFERFPENQF